MASMDMPSQSPIANITPTNYAGQQIRQVVLGSMDVFLADHPGTNLPS